MRQLQGAKELSDTTAGLIFSIPYRFYVGQNIFILYSWGVTPNGNQDWPTAVQYWYNEVEDFSKDSVSPFQ
jgi:hypothetical protein